MSDPHARQAVAYVAARASGGAMKDPAPVTLNFHPDAIRDGETVIAHLAREKIYRSQFETGLSAGGLTAYRGGDRWAWESRMFGGAYDDAPADRRPKYGALNLRRKSVGASPRFGSCHLRLSERRRADVTFCHPDSHLDPVDFGTARRMGVVEAYERAPRAEDPLDDYIEAHVHGPLTVPEDFEAVVLDPSFRGGPIEDAAAALGAPIEWHGGFALRRDQLDLCAEYRDPAASAVLSALCDGDAVRPSDLSAMRRAPVDPGALKRAWHCLARFGDPDAQPR